MNRVNHRGEAPVLQQIRDLSRQPLDPRVGIGDRVDVILQDNPARARCVNSISAGRRRTSPS